MKERHRFVVQHHIASRDHFDFRLEIGGVLVSWAVPKGPSYNPDDKRLAVRVEDHPLEYRDFEGVIPKGMYGGGTVMLWDEGYFTPQQSAAASLAAGSLKFILNGSRLRGKWALVQMKKEGGSEDNWLLIKETDEFAKDAPGISDYVTSVRTSRTMKQIADGMTAVKAKNPFSKTGVQLATLAHTFPRDGEWVYELKYDGYRIIAYVENGNARLLSRNGNDYTERFRDVAHSLIRLSAGRPMVLDGEMVITDDNGRSDFGALQRHIKHPDEKPTYIIFDLLAYGGEDMRGQALTARKAKLKELMKKAPDNLHYSEHTEKIDTDSFNRVCGLGLEGLIGKKADSVYSGSRNGDWIKLKCESRQEFVIGGYSVSEKKPAGGGISSILVGYFEGTDLVYAGRAGTGFTEETQRDLEKRFGKLVTKTSPFSAAPAAKKGERVIFLKPELAAEIKFAEWTSDNLLRQASFKGLREDKDTGEIVRETGGGGTRVEISSPEKLMFTGPDVTKLEVAEYYQKISKRMMPYVQGRIMSLVCCPKGISGACHFKKHLPGGAEGIENVNIKNSGGDDESYFCITGVSGVIYLVQMNTVEFHTWGCLGANPEKPDIMVFDLDPDEGMDIENIRQGVTDLKSILDELSLISYLKTSGGKGYHVVVPFAATADWETFRAFAKNIAGIMEQNWPERYTTNMRKEKRKNKIFIDWVRNGRGATSIAPYSVRARKGAHISMPIEWSELYKVTPDGITIPDALTRLKTKDPWRDFFKTKEKQKLK